MDTANVYWYEHGFLESESFGSYSSSANSLTVVRLASPGLGFLTCSMEIIPNSQSIVRTEGARTYQELNTTTNPDQMIPLTY